MSMGWIDGRRNLGWLVIACSLMIGVGTAQAQDASALAGRLDRLERDLQVLQRQAYRDQSGSGGGGDAMTSEGSAQLFVKISQLEEQMRDLTGQIEQLSFKIDQTQQRLDRVSADVDYRFQSLEKPPGAANGTGAVAEPPPASTQTGGSTVGVLGATQGAQPTPAQPAPAQSAATAAEAYRDAFNLLKKADYPAAEAAFQGFLKQYGDTEYAGNAQYWLGETYYVRGQFEKAAVAFADGYKKYRKGPKAPDSLLKLGFSMRKMNQNDKACAALDQFLKEFAGAPKVQTEMAQRARTELKCR